MVLLMINNNNSNNTNEKKNHKYHYHSHTSPHNHANKEMIVISNLGNRLYCPSQQHLPGRFAMPILGEQSRATGLGSWPNLLRIVSRLSDLL